MSIADDLRNRTFTTPSVLSVWRRLPETVEALAIARRLLRAGMGTSSNLLVGMPRAIRADRVAKPGWRRTRPWKA
jgi:hypothetical protein